MTSSTPSAYYARHPIEKAVSDLGTNLETGLSSNEAINKRKAS
ncbi:1701_t:CDS:1, partial [Acaulospora morrowiae]